MKCYVASVFLAVIAVLMKSAVLDAADSSDPDPLNQFLAKSARNKSVAEGNNTFQPTSTPAMCKGKGEPCVPLDFDCCGAYLACDTFELKCVTENT